MIEIDGSIGGGQILRTALSLSAITQKPFRIKNIRKSRPKPGLKAQHIKCVEGVAQLCNAKFSGCTLKSKELEFIPNKLNPKSLSIDIGTAGSISLFLQAMIPPIIHAGKNISIEVFGGTDTMWCPPIDYFKEVFLPHIRKYANYEFKLLKRGYYPKGAGHVILKLKPQKLVDIRIKNITLLEFKDVLVIKGISHASMDLMKRRVAERQAKTAELILKDYSTDISNEYSTTKSTGSGIVLWALTGDDDDGIDFDNPIIFGADSLGKKGKSVPEVAQVAADEVLKLIKQKSCLDKLMADQMLLYLGLYPNSRIKVPEISDHIKTNINTIEKFLDVKFKIEDDIISVE
ncbi:RNA 3'-terminal phosphate cyclase [archaeon]|jgi:RNA 3'-phosphate cyclase|nr:RNA 3'-terminal phosphate cyclase [archaeon]MBT4351105.1 RNA 3'-terminal phosphate cyclase [archaeon]MBT4648087.1 RNA 3'-terminal phosphate cyclase [archaeon]MBT6822525.1 RNA 3'-terminal phosphate cyclase [archaeon]MBT7392526.1 RNA 3'-terminal phosphate cyclase [archaeon]